MQPFDRASASPGEPGVRSEVERRELERGELAFAVRPRVENAPGIQRFMLLLEAESGPARRIVVGKKQLPRARTRERAWAYVERVCASMHELWDDLGPTTRMTKSRGVRRQPGAHEVALATYRIASHGEHTHLDYVLREELVDRHVLDQSAVHAHGSLIVAVFNPLATWSRRVTAADPGDPDEPAPFREPSIFSDELQEKVGERRFAALEPAMLDVEGVELILIDGIAA